MKLSQKLLALSGVAVADYACCAYDDYGIPSDCGLTEKTPFAGDDWRNNACKAWEGNPDASFDGNDNACDDSENWSSCGFQRHFPWVDPGTDVGYSGAAGTALTYSGLSFEIGAGENHYTIGGAPFLGGVCKLWMPVPEDKVLSVNVAGVHIGGTGEPVSRASDFGAVTGVAYCFSVVNPAEFMSNDNGIHNGNVAGWRTDLNAVELGGDFMRSDIFEGMSQTDRQQGVQHTFERGSRAPQTPFGGGDSSNFEGEVLVGPNFDVVAHFDHSWCTDSAHWTVEDMQMPGDWGNGGTDDYPLGAGDIEEHDHTDTVDKRFSQDLAAINDFYACSGACNTNAGMTIGVAPELYRWPNAGAFAGFYSFVACANADASGDDTYNLLNAYKYVFQNFAPSGACGMSGTEIIGADGQDCIIGRTVVVSLGQDDFRAEDCNAAGTRQLTARFNVRQAGKHIRNCGPGTVPDSDTARCSWNWNFKGFSTTDPADTFTDPESFFERSSPRNFAPWNAGPVNDRLLQEGNPSSPIQNVQISVGLSDAAGAAAAGELSVEIPADYIANEVAFAGGSHTFDLVCVGGADGSRDTFPDCFQGEEIHYQWTGVADADSSTRLNPWATTVTADFTI